jgi:hypothetical protein
VLLEVMRVREPAKWEMEESGDLDNVRNDNCREGSGNVSFTSQVDL